MYTSPPGVISGFAPAPGPFPEIPIPEAPLPEVPALPPKVGQLAKAHTFYILVFSEEVLSSFLEIQWNHLLSALHALVYHLAPHNLWYAVNQRRFANRPWALPIRPENAARVGKITSFRGIQTLSFLHSSFLTDLAHSVS